MKAPNPIQSRRAIEALRAGVPNKDAVVGLGCDQIQIESLFRAQLEEMKHQEAQPQQQRGLLVSGGFGSGKSHLLEYLYQIALDLHFVCSKIVIGKETPIYDTFKLFRESIQQAVVPGRRGDALTEVCASLNHDSELYVQLERTLRRKGSAFDPVFAATLFLFENDRGDQELVNKIIRFWSGDPFSLPDIRRYLRERGAASDYQIKRVARRELAPQYFDFVSSLVTAAGYSGWLLLVDEVELMGRYSVTQRARSYPEIHRLLRHCNATDVGRLTCVLAITDDFAAEIIDERGKGDTRTVPLKLEQYHMTDRNVVDHAVRGMNLIRREAVLLRPPKDLSSTYSKVRSIYDSAYGQAPEIDLPARPASTSIREHIKSWITEWDLRRLDPGYRVEIQVSGVNPIYVEDPSLQISEDAESGVDEVGQPVAPKTSR